MGFVLKNMRIGGGRRRVVETPSPTELPPTSTDEVCSSKPSLIFLINSLIRYVLSLALPCVCRMGRSVIVVGGMGGALIDLSLRRR